MGKLEILSIYENDPSEEYTLMELVELTGLNKATISRNLKRLVKSNELGYDTNKFSVNSDRPTRVYRMI